MKNFIVWTLSLWAAFLIAGTALPKFAQWANAATPDITRQIDTMMERKSFQNANFNKKILKKVNTLLPTMEKGSVNESIMTYVKVKLESNIKTLATTQKKAATHNAAEKTTVTTTTTKTVPTVTQKQTTARYHQAATLPTTADLKKSEPETIEKRWFFHLPKRGTKWATDGESTNKKAEAILPAWFNVWPQEIPEKVVREKKQADMKEFKYKLKSHRYTNQCVQYDCYNACRNLDQHTVRDGYTEAQAKKDCNNTCVSNYCTTIKKKMWNFEKYKIDFVDLDSK